MIALNKTGIRYILLGHSEVGQLSAGASKPSEVIGAVYVSTSREFCEISLSRRNPAEIENKCRVKIETNTRLPIAISVAHGSWIVAKSID